jgi:hypothetical protein
MISFTIIVLLLLLLLISPSITKSHVTTIQNNPLDYPIEDQTRIQDRINIQSFFAAYARTIDGSCENKEWQGWENLFTPHAILDFSAALGPRGKRDQVIADLKSIMIHFDSCLHLISNVEIQFVPGTTDQARVRALVFYELGIRYFPFRKPFFSAVAYYNHDMQKINGIWKSNGVREDVIYITVIQNIVLWVIGFIGMIFVVKKKYI